MLDGNGAGCGDAASDRSFFYPTAPLEWYSVSSAGRPGSGAMAHGSCSPSAGRGVGRGVRNSEQSGESAPHRPSQLRGYGLRGERDRPGPTGGAVRGPLRECSRAKTTRNMPRRRRARRDCRPALALTGYFEQPRTGVTNDFTRIYLLCFHRGRSSGDPILDTDFRGPAWIGQPTGYGGLILESFYMGRSHWLPPV